MPSGTAGNSRITLPPAAGDGPAIVRHIVGRHGRRVWVEGAPAQGATFYFTLGRG